MHLNDISADSSPMSLINVRFRDSYFFFLNDATITELQPGWILIMIAYQDNHVSSNCIKKSFRIGNFADQLKRLFLHLLLQMILATLIEHLLFRHLKCSVVG
jgi:hypothetical protein